MKLYILTDVSHIPYEGTYTNILGVFSEREKAIEAIKVLMGTENYKWYTENNRNKAVFVDGLPVEDNNTFVYFDDYDRNSLEIEEVILNEYSKD